MGVGTLLFNGIVLVLGNAYLGKTLAAEQKILTLEARIEELEEGDTVAGLDHRLTEIEGLTNTHDGQISSLDSSVTTHAGQI